RGVGRTSGNRETRNDDLPRAPWHATGHPRAVLYRLCDTTGVELTARVPNQQADDDWRVTDEPRSSISANSCTGRDDCRDGLREEGAAARAGSASAAACRRTPTASATTAAARASSRCRTRTCCAE